MDFQMFNPDPEAIKALRKQQDMLQMETESQRHEMLEWIVSMDLETTNMLRTLIYTVRTADGYGSYVEGILTAKMQMKHNVCMACGKDHDRMLLPESVEPASDGTVQMSIDEVLDESEYSSNLELYGMRPPKDEAVELATPDEKPVICRGCGMLYQSLEDRMLRAPREDGCHGCHLKAATG